MISRTKFNEQRIIGNFDFDLIPDFELVSGEDPPAAAPAAVAGRAGTLPAAPG